MIGGGSHVFRSRIARRYCAMLAGFIGVAALAFGAVQAFLVFGDARTHATRLQASELATVGTQLDDSLSAVTSGLERVCRMPWSSSLLTAVDQRGELQRLLAQYPAIVELQAVGGNGLETAFVSRVSLDRVASLRRAEVPRTMDGATATFGEVFLRDQLAPHVRIACREDGVAAGAVIAAEINLEFVSEMVGESARRLDGDAFVVDGGQRLIAHSRPVAIFSAGDAASLGVGSATPGAGPVTSHWIGGWSDGALVGWMPLKAAPWRIAVSQPASLVLAPAVHRVAVTGAVALVLAIVSALFAIALAAHLSEPIRRLRNAVAEAGRGNLAQRIEIRTGDELEDLATEFNAMAAQLQQYTTGLERMVAEKTVELQDALKVAHDAMRAKAVFLAAASHDLRQPLYAISILADALALEDMPPAAASVLEKQRQAIGVLRGLFDNLLDLSRFDAGDVKPAMRAVLLRDVLAPLAAEYEVMCAAKRLAWICELDDARVSTDPQLLRRLVGNLLSNAVRYTEAGSVRLSARREGARVLLEIADTGIGIAPVDQERVFDEFVQLANPSRERDKGVGLGLSIVRRIDQLLATKLTLESAPGSGTRFTLELASTEDVADSTRPRAIAPQATDLAGLRVWVVEDDALVRGALASQFHAWAVDHAFASNRAEVESLQRKDGAWPDAAILDDMLESGERGLDIARWLALHMPMERIVFVTGNVDRERLRLLEENGFAVMRKPLAAADLARWLASAVRSSPAVAP